VTWPGVLKGGESLGAKPQPPEAIGGFYSERWAIIAKNFQ